MTDISKWQYNKGWTGFSPSNIPASRGSLELMAADFESPRVAQGVLSLEERRDLLKFFYDHKKAEETTVFAVTAINTHIKDWLTEKFKGHFNTSRYEPVLATFVKLLDAPGPHIDAYTIRGVEGIEDHTTCLECMTGKITFIPIAVDDRVDVPDEELKNVSTVFTKQRWFGVGTNFRRGQDLSLFSFSAKARKAIDDYTGMVRYTGEPFPDEPFLKYFEGSMHQENLFGMELGEVIPWKLGNASVQDTSLIHMSSNFFNQGFKSKVFLNVHWYDKYATKYLEDCYD